MITRSNTIPRDSSQYKKVILRIYASYKKGREMEKFLSLIENEDLAIFRIPSESTEGDRVSLLMVQNAIRAKFKQYRYLEVGSHMGGMLVPHLCDPDCVKVLSIDKRPPSQYDARGRSFDYNDNSTARMIDNIKSTIPNADISKLTTIDSDVSEISDNLIIDKFDLLMIDAEHTNLAATSDFLSLINYGHRDSIFLFHDANLVYEAVLICDKFLTYLGISHETIFLYDNVAAILFGSSQNLAPQFSRRTQERSEYIKSSREYIRSQVAANNPT